MDRKEIEQLLKSQKNTFVPNINNKIQEIKNMGIKRVPVSDKQKKHTTWNYKIIIAAACAVVVVAVVLLLVLPPQVSYTEHYLYIDINPSIKLCINNKGKVTDVQMLNQDSMSTFDEGLIKGKKYNKALDAIMDSLYAKQNFDNEDYEIILSMEEDADNTLITKYNNYIIEKINSYSINANVINNSLSKQDIVDMEQDDRLTPGKLKYIKEIEQLSNGNEIDPNELKDMELNKLRKIKYILEEDKEVSFEDLKDLKDNELNDKYIQTKDDVANTGTPPQDDNDDNRTPGTPGEDDDLNTNSPDEDDDLSANSPGNDDDNDNDFGISPPPKDDDKAMVQVLVRTNNPT